MPRPATTGVMRATAIIPNGIGNPGSSPSGITACMILCRDVNPTTGTISRIDMWTANSFLLLLHGVL